MNEHVTEFLERYPAALALAAAVGCAVGGWLLTTGLFGALRAYERRQDSALARSARAHLRQASAFFFPVLLLAFVLPLLPLEGRALAVVRRVVDIAFIGTFAWGLVGTVDVAQDLVLAHYQLAGPGDNLRVRKLLTQLQFVKKMLVSLIVFVAAALVLMSFATVRRVGTGLLASAGIASVVVGFAAQRSLSNLLAGFQIAFTQPIRLDDVLVVEGEWGRVEEITFTYVVLRIWDERRLVLPLTYFIEKPFQNWTRTSSQLLGTVFLYVDHALPVAAVRAELQRILAASPRWDGRVAVLQVTDVKERTVELRALMSAVDSSTAFDLRCEVREQLVAFVQQHHPEGLPKTRAVVGPEELFQGAAPGGAPGAGALE
jgi:small-conductance mechanosensitive channel